MRLEENAFILPFFQVFIIQIENTLNSGCVTKFIRKAGFSCMEVKCIQNEQDDLKSQKEPFLA